jgi:hypothetical protein
MGEEFPQQLGRHIEQVRYPLLDDPSSRRKFDKPSELKSE